MKLYHSYISKATDNLATANNFCLYAVYDVGMAWSSDYGSIIGTNVLIPMQVSSQDRFYLNTARPAPCNGTITHFGYCYYGRQGDINERETYQALVSVYRPMAAEMDS